MLDEAAERLWSAPRGANDSIYAESDETVAARGRQDEPTLARQSCSPLAPRSESDGRNTSAERRTLNPRFVEVLMNFPEGWTALDVLATPFCRWWQLMRFALSRL